MIGPSNKVKYVEKINPKSHWIKTENPQSKKLTSKNQVHASEELTFIGRNQLFHIDAV